MRLQVKVLHFVDGIGPLGGTQTISRGNVDGGPRAAEDIQRVNGGYFVKNVTGGRPGSYFVPDARVACAQVEEIADESPAGTGSQDKSVRAPEWSKPAPTSGGVSGGNLKPLADGMGPAGAFDASAPRSPEVESLPPPRTIQSESRATPADAPPIDLALIPGHTLPDGMKVNASGVFSREHPTPPVAAEGDLPPAEVPAASFQPSRRRPGPNPAKS